MVRTDREAIHELKYEYHRSLDADETDAMLSVFTDDAVIHHDGAANSLHGIQEYQEWIEDVTSGRFRSTHMAMNPIVTLDGDEATGQWQYFVVNDRGADLSFGQGSYDDSYQRTGDGWRIASSTIYRNYSIAVDPESVTRDRPAAFFEARPYLEQA
ncbi:MAG: nuclear transport factor 2 family protein [Salinirussus sp.]